MILYFCPDSDMKSAGLRILYRHIEILCKHGFEAAILHDKPGFRMTDMPEVPVRSVQVRGHISPGDVVVVPEVFPQIHAQLRNSAVRRIIIALNWRYVYQYLPEGSDYRTYNIERVISHSPFIADYVHWAMDLPTHAFVWGVKESLYYAQPGKKVPQLAYIQRKQEEVPEIMGIFRSRNPDLVTKINWVPLHGLEETAYAAQIRRSMLFLSISRSEGLPCSILEAMRCGTLIAGFNSVGSQRELSGEGPKQNCILAENLDYIALAKRMEPLLTDIVAGNTSRWETMRQNAFETSSAYTREAEESTVLAMWREIMQK